ncbi:hypothetical protein L2K20_20455 [Mycobacterium sp. MBM]|nr:hypothetical protein [Mycobacterium sp. MBM]
MSSDIERIAKALRELAADAGRTGDGVSQAHRRITRLVDQAHAQGRSGLAMGPLVGQLRGAADKARGAANSVEQIERHGKGFADHLAARGGGGGGPVSVGFLGDMAVAATAFLGFAGTPQTMLNDSPDLTGPGEVGGSSMIQRSLDAADNGDDLNTGLKKRNDTGDAPVDRDRYR